MAKAPAEQQKEVNLLGWLEAIPVVWLVLVLCAYALLVMQPLTPQLLRQEVPGVVELERWVLPLLAALVAGAILRYLHGRGSGTPPNEKVSSESRSKAEAVHSS